MAHHVKEVDLSVRCLDLAAPRNNDVRVEHLVGATTRCRQETIGADSRVTADAKFITKQEMILVCKGTYKRKVSRPKGMLSAERGRGATVW